MSSNNIYTCADRTPYTYHIAWSNLDKHYYGVRFAKNCHPNDLWVKYFTSSKYVKDMREQYGEPDVIEIRRTFTSVETAREWEYKVLQRLNVCVNERWINLTATQSIPLIVGKLAKKMVKNRLKNGDGDYHHGHGNPFQSEQIRQSVSTRMKENHPLHGPNANPETLDKWKVAFQISLDRRKAQTAIRHEAEKLVASIGPQIPQSVLRARKAEQTRLAREERKRQIQDMGPHISTHLRISRNSKESATSRYVNIYNERHQLIYTGALKVIMREQNLPYAFVNSCEDNRPIAGNRPSTRPYKGWYVIRKEVQYV